MHFNVKLWQLLHRKYRRTINVIECFHSSQKVHWDNHHSWLDNEVFYPNIMALKLLIITENLENKPFCFSSPFAKWDNYWIEWSIKAGLIFLQSLYDLGQQSWPTCLSCCELESSKRQAFGYISKRVSKLGKLGWEQPLWLLAALFHGLGYQTAKEKVN